MVMQPVNKFQEKVNTCKKSLSEENEKLTERLNSYKVISEKIFHNITSQIDCIFRKNLRVLFGDENSPDIAWFHDEFLNFRETPSDELVFSFWGCDGSESYHRKEEPLPFLRENIYLRGTRWENKETRAQFYKNFRRIKYLFENYVPVDFFGCLAEKCPPILRITTNASQTESQVELQGVPTIVLPLGESFVKGFSEGSSLRKLAEYICKCSKNAQREIEDKEIEGFWNEIRKKKEINDSVFIDELHRQFENVDIIFSSKEKNTNQKK